MQNRSTFNGQTLFEIRDLKAAIVDSVKRIDKCEIPGNESDNGEKSSNFALISKVI